MLSEPAQAGSEISLWRHGCHQDAGGSVVRLQILLYDDAAQGVADDHRFSGQAVGNQADILDIIGERTGTQLRSRAISMAAKAYRQSAITLVREEA